MTDEKNRKLVEQVVRKLMSRLGDDIEFLKENGIGVTVFAFTFTPGAIAYISTANREDMIRSVKEWTAAQEVGMTSEPRGERGRS